MFIRDSRLLSGIAAVLLCSGAAHAATTDLTGYWRVERYVEELRTVDGKPPPLKPAALALYEQRKAQKNAGKLDFDPAAKCINPGLPRTMFLPYAVEFLQSADNLTLLFAWNHLFRVIDLSGKPVVSDQPSYLGVASGKWQGQTLAVETIGLKEEALLDASGLPGSAEMTVTERYTLSKNGKTLTNEITINDPTNYTTPWTTRAVYRKLPADFHFVEDVCLDRIQEGRPAIEVPHEIPRGMPVR